MTIIVPKDSIWMHTEMNIPELTKCMLKSTENNCFLSECRNAGGFFLCCYRVLMTVESGLSMFLDILSNSNSRNRHKRSSFSINLYPSYLIFFAFLFFPWYFSMTLSSSSDPLHAFTLALAFLLMCHTSVSLGSVLLLAQRTFILI